MRTIFFYLASVSVQSFVFENCEKKRAACEAKCFSGPNTITEHTTPYEKSNQNVLIGSNSQQ